MQYRSVQ